MFSVQEPPYVITTKTNPTSNEDFTGYIPDLLKEFAKHEGCNCEFKLHVVGDGKYGVYENTQWNGMIREILDQVSLIGLAYASRITAF